MTFQWSVIGLALVTGCGTSATITRASAPAVEGKIVSSSQYDVYVADGHGGSEAIPRSQITDVDHPGNVAATLGALVSAYGVANVAVGLPECDKQGAAYCTGVFLPIGIGLPVMIWGIATYAVSVSAVNERTKTDPTRQMFLMPTHQFAGQPETPGLTVGSTF